MTFNPLDKNGFIFMMTTLWDKIKAIIPTKTSQLQNDSGFKTTDTTYSVVSKTANGLAPKLPNETATTKYLRQDGTWQVPPNTTYSAVTQSANGLMTAADKKKLDGIATGANKTSITNSLTATVAGTALDATQGKALDDKGKRIKFEKKDDGYHFRDWSGADTVIPFSSSSILELNSDNFSYYTCAPGKTRTEKLENGKYVYVIFQGSGGSNTVRGSIYESEIPGAFIYFYQSRYGLADTAKSNEIYLYVSSNGASATLIFYKISD